MDPRPHVLQCPVLTDFDRHAVELRLTLIVLRPALTLRARELLRDLDRDFCDRDLDRDFCDRDLDRDLDLLDFLVLLFFVDRPRDLPRVDFLIGGGAPIFFVFNEV